MKICVSDHITNRSASQAVEISVLGTMVVIDQIQYITLITFTTGNHLH